MSMPDAPPLTCRELVELVTDYLEGSLPGPERARFDAHISRCDGCTAYLAQMRRTISLTGRLGEDDLSPAVRDDLLDLFRDWKRQT
jgi:anti-sigma factor RsiW